MAYFALLIIALAGALAIFLRRYGAVRVLSADELKGRLLTSSSVRRELKNNYISPTLKKLRQIWVGAFWMYADKFVRFLRSIVENIAGRLKYLSENMKGRHINFNVGEKTEYWQTLNGAKSKGRTEAKTEPLQDKEGGSREL